MTAAKQPPELPGEVWRGVDLLLEPIAVVLVDDTYRAMWWDAGDGAAGGVWSQCADRGYMTEVLAAWALDLSARLSASFEDARLSRELYEAEKGERERQEKSEEEALAQAEYYQDQIARIAAAVGCGEEWSNLHAHACCIDDAFDAVTARAERAEKIAAAERALRLAERATWEAIANGGLGEQQSAGMDEAAAYRALCALGVEP